MLLHRIRGLWNAYHGFLAVVLTVVFWTYLVLIGLLILRSGHTRTRAISEGEDPNAITVLVLGSLMAVASLAAIGMELARAASPASWRPS